MRLAEKMKWIDEKIKALPSWEAWLSEQPKHGVTGPSAALAMAAVRAMADPESAKLTGGHYVEMATSDGKVPAIALGETKDEAEFHARAMSFLPPLLAIASNHASYCVAECNDAFARGDVEAAKFFQERAINIAALLSEVFLNQNREEFFAELFAVGQTAH